jgi:hypothetical protein
MQIIITLDKTTPTTAMDMIFPEIENLIPVYPFLFFLSPQIKVVPVAHHQ